MCEKGARVWGMETEGGGELEWEKGGKKTDVLRVYSTSCVHVQEWTCMYKFSKLTLF